MPVTEEHASDISIEVGSVSIAVDSLSLNEDWDFTKRYGSGRNDPKGRSMGHKDAGGSFTVVGLGKKELNSVLFDQNGDPVEFTITITHNDGSSTTVNKCVVESRGYEVNDGDMTETSYDYDAMTVDGPWTN